MVAWKKIMGKFEVEYWMGAQKEEGGLAGKGTKDFGPVPAKGPYSKGGNGLNSADSGGHHETSGKR